MEQVKVSLIRYPTDDDWMLVKRAALVTVGLKPITVPAQDWRHMMLVQRHSPIRELKIVFSLENIPYWLSTEFSRHIHAQPYIRSQRNDRQGAYDRNAARQDAPVNMIWSFNGQSIMEVANKRLCRLATKDAQHVMRIMCSLLQEQCQQYKGVLVPMCGYHGGWCHQGKGCGKCPVDNMG